MNDRIDCMICGAKVHSIQLHLKQDHQDTTLEDYQRRFADAPLLSKVAEAKLKEHADKKAAATVAHAAVAATVTPIRPAGESKKALHEIFELGAVPAALNARKEPIPITVLDTGTHPDLVPAIDPGHVWDIDLLKNMLMAFELNTPLYAWGHKGSGKTTGVLQIAGRTNRPTLRIQHTINTEEAHIIGQWGVKGGETVYNPGPLPMAMRYGWTYVADEYDFALPSVLAVYQPVLEGNSLVIKDGPPEWFIVKPHPNFRFVATGNTNGAGDDTGLYQGTSIQNSANYDRFGVVIQVFYMKPEQEALIIVNQAKINKADATKLVDFANRVREAYDGGKVADTISPRALINAARLGLRRGSWRTGLALAFINKLSKVDREVVDGLAQRVFG